MSTNFSHCGNFVPSVPVQMTQIVFLSVILVLSLVGNSLIIIVVYNYKRPELRKTVNYLIVNMAVSDFVFPLTAIPASLAEMSTGSFAWPISGTAGLILCKLRSFLMSVSLTVSIESLVWIAFDRFLAVVWPMKVRRISSRFRSFAVVSTWIGAVVLSFLDLYFYHLIIENDTMKCSADLNSPAFIAFVYTKMTVINIAPVVLITILYSAMTVNLRRRDKALQRSAAQRTDHKKRRAIKTSLCVLASFDLFFLPAAMALILWRTPVSSSCLFFNHFFLFSSSAVYISSTTNPIICFTFVESFRRGLREILHFSVCNRFKAKAKRRAGREEIILKIIRVISGIEDNLAFN